MEEHDTPYVWGEAPETEEDPEEERLVIVEGHAVQFNEYRY